ncbi:Methyltransferase domain-containing protein [Clostridium collagenovorans DSM 3089]|uniref:Methyltransferase domain-containing protein n=1 Tax=Clostridium collagenovorans DSM 3089 TaxID=1121306 RepID=A0A1M5VET4_9CLOT|nr:methyltransferase domain-containing protein [Clostridium collagenovorans]SHH73736.1 Methyltransferase domain-containing protein [Clostridium collagenovorans DSM 3089]
MHKYLMDMLQCPFCHSNLTWDISNETEERLIEGHALCTQCNATYEIHDGIGVFLTPELQRNDLWEESNTLFLEHPELVDALMEHENNDLCATDRFVKAMLLDEQGNFEEAMPLFKNARADLYTKDIVKGTESQLEFLCNYLKNSCDPIVDIASGRCYLVEELAKNLDNYIVATDFSPSILKRDKAALEHLGLYNKVSLLSFDARLTPFKDASVKIMTSNLGLANIQDSANVLNELRRVLEGELLFINHFYAENDEPNINVLKYFKVDTFATEKTTKEAFKASNLDLKIANELFAYSTPISKGEIIDAAPDITPIVATNISLHILKAK